MNEQPQDQMQMFDYKSRQPVKSAGCFMRTCSLLSLEISPVYIEYSCAVTEKKAKL